MGSATTPTTVSTATMPTSMTDAEATRLGLKVYNIGTTYNSVAITFTSAIAQTYTTTFSSLIPYQTQGGTWRLKFNISGTFSSSVIANTDITIDMNGVFGAGGQPAIVVAGATGSVLYPTAYGVTAPLRFNFSFTTANTAVNLSGDIALGAKPTWAF